MNIHQYLLRLRRVVVIYPANLQVIMVEVTLEKVNHGKLKFTMVNGTASVTPNFQFTMVNLTLVSCPDNSGKNKVDLTPDKNLVTKKKRWVHLLSI